MFGIASIVAFALAIIMHIAGWGSGALNVELFTLTGLLCLALHLVVPWGRHA